MLNKLLFLLVGLSSLCFGENHPMAHSIQSETEVTSPQNRARTRLGVGEVVKLTLSPDHDANWSIESGGAPCHPTKE